MRANLDCYFICASCNYIIDGYDTYDQDCESCGSRWCNICKPNIKQFYFGEKKYCTICWNGHFNDTQIVNHVIKKHKTTREQLREEMQPKNEVFCVNPHEQQICGNYNCSKINELTKKYSMYVLPCIGICCITRTAGYEDGSWCDGCFIAENKPKVITFLLINKTKRIFPKDIAIRIAKMIYKIK